MAIFSEFKRRIRRYFRLSTGEILPDWHLDILIEMANRTCSQVLPFEAMPFADIPKVEGEYKLAFVSNLANNHYILSGALSEKGINCRLLFEPSFMDNYPLSHPAWEEQCGEYSVLPDVESISRDWAAPERCIACGYDNTLYFLPRLFDYDTMNARLSGTGITVKEPVHYLKMLNVLPHLELLRHMNEADVLQVSGNAIGLASFLDKPYVTFPFGGDLYITPFTDNIHGWHQVQGFRRAAMHVASGGLMLDSLHKLGIDDKKIARLPMMIDTDRYSPISESSLRAELERRYPGKFIIFMFSRQNWYWKGNDKFFRAMARIPEIRDRAVLICPWWGQDLDASDALIHSLGLEDCIVKLGILNKGALKQYIDAADLCVDQFTLGAIGAASLEAMSLGKPLMVFHDAGQHFSFAEPVPVLNACSEDEIFEALLVALTEGKSMSALGRKAREWVIKYHSVHALWPEYDQVYRKAISTYRAV